VLVPEDSVLVLVLEDSVLGECVAPHDGYLENCAGSLQLNYIGPLLAQLAKATNGHFFALCGRELTSPEFHRHGSGWACSPAQ